MFDTARGNRSLAIQTKQGSAIRHSENVFFYLTGATDTSNSYANVI